MAGHNPLEGERSEMRLKLHDGTDEQVSIIIVHKDRPEYLNILLQSIAVTSYNNNYEIIVVDNASGKETQGFLKEIESEVKVVRNEKNLFWSAACNRGAEAAGKNSKYLIFMHCDVVITSHGWLDLLVNVSESQSSGMVGVEMSSYFLEQTKVDFIQEWCVLMTRDCWNDCGPWIEELPMVGHAFIMTLKAQHKGYQPQMMKNPICHHYRIFSVDINTYEKMTENAMATIPKLIRDVQSVPVRSSI